MSPVRVQRKRTKGWKMPENTIYVGRGSKWGNPFVVGDDFSIMHNQGWGSQRILTLRNIHPADTVTLYGLWLANHYVGDEHHASIAEVRAQLAGKNLACWCREDQPCHADVLLELANR